jgi:hypothetical protein
MTVHMLHAQNHLPVCWQTKDMRGLTQEVFVVGSNIDNIDCVLCLRLLAKDAVLYGNRRKPSRKW